MSLRCSLSQPGCGSFRDIATARHLRLSQSTQAYPHPPRSESQQGETNSFSLHGLSGVSDPAEAAIWLADYALQAATLNVKEVDFHGGVGFA